MNQSKKVVPLNTPVADRTVDYKGYRIRVKFRPETKDYMFGFQHGKPIIFDGMASSPESCISEAKKQIDALKGEK